MSVAKSSCAREMRRLAESGKEARVPSSLAGGTGERSKVAAAAAELVEMSLAENDADDEEGVAIRGRGAAEESVFFPPSVRRRVTLREELIVTMEKGGRREARRREGAGKSESVSKSRAVVVSKGGLHVVAVGAFLYSLSPHFFHRPLLSCFARCFLPVDPLKSVQFFTKSVSSSLSTLPAKSRRQLEQRGRA